MRDLHHNIAVRRSIHPQAVGTTGAANGVTGAAIDLQGYQGAEIIYSYGTIPSTTETLTAVLLEGDTATGSFTSVADADLLGTEADASIAAGTRVSGTNKNVSKKLGYVGGKRFIKPKIFGVGTATALVDAVVILHHPRHAPSS